MTRRQFIKQSLIISSLLGFFSFFQKESISAISSLNEAVLKAKTALKRHLTYGLNKLGLPKSYIPLKEYRHPLPYPDRCYIFDLGALLIYTSLNPEKWAKDINPVIENIIKLQNPDGMWARSYDDSGIAESGFFTGPACVLARGLLSWGKGKDSENSNALNAAIKTADYLLQDFNKIQVSDFYVLKQETGKKTSPASPEENARAAIFFMDPYNFFTKNQKNEALHYLTAAENILLGICSQRKEIYPFGIFPNGEANWNMPDREGVEGQAVMLQALYLYSRVLDKEKTPQSKLLLEKDLLLKDEILKWIEKTHASRNKSFTNINDVNAMIPLGFSKKISQHGKAENHLWTEFTARMALTYLSVFNRKDLWRQLIEGMILLNQPSGFLPYAVGFNGYKEPPAWPVGPDQRMFNYPFGSLAATVEFLFATEGNNSAFERFA